MRSAQSLEEILLATEEYVLAGCCLLHLDVYLAAVVGLLVRTLEPIGAVDTERAVVEHLGEELTGNRQRYA